MLRRDTHTTSLLLAVLLLGGACTPFDKPGEAPVANAGLDQSLSGSGEVSLDGSESFDPDGEIVEYEWRYTGEPEGFSEPDPDADPLDALLEPLPEFCMEDDHGDHEVMIPARYCLIGSGTGEPDELRVTLDPGGYRFTLWVIDDDGMVSGDSVEVIVDP